MSGLKLDESKFTKEVLKIIKNDGKRNIKYAIPYAIKHRVSLVKVKGTLGMLNAASGCIHRERSCDLEKAGGVLSADDLTVAVRMVRHISEKSAAEDLKFHLKKHGLPRGMQVSDVSIEGVPLPAEWQVIDGAPSKVLMYIHGGGLVLGSKMGVRAFTSTIARDAGVRVLSVEYRLLPEHPHPVQINDVLRAYEYLLASGYKGREIVIGGDSAGGLLTLMLLLKIRDAGLEPPAGAVCLSPAADLTFSAASVFDNMPSDPVLGPSGSLVILLNVLRMSNVDPSSPEISPLAADLKDLPPMLFQASTNEMLYDDSRRMVEKAKAAGVDATLQAWNKMVHVFPAIMQLHGEADEARARIVEFIRQKLNL